MRKILHFKNQSEYNKNKDKLVAQYGGGGKWTAMSAEENSIIHDQNSLMDVIFYSHELETNIVVDSRQLILTNYPQDKFTPIGIIAIPKSHNIYGDNSVGVISLCGMDCDTPLNGSTKRQDMYWGVRGNDVVGLKYFNITPKCSSYLGNKIIGLTTKGCLPTTNTINNAISISDDLVAEYRSKNDPIPSPYLNDGERNLVYCQTLSPSSTRNALADFDGRGNTDKILVQRGVKDYSIWKPTYNTNLDYPAASCCDMFSTVGTKQGDWYLPSCGEFGYVIARFQEIDNTLHTLKSFYTETTILDLSSSARYWSSSQGSDYNANYLYANSGLIGNHAKDQKYRVRAFTKMKF